MMKERLMRQVKPAEMPKVGDTCRMIDDDSAFGTCIVLDVEAGQVHVARPYCKVDKIGCCKGTVYTGVEAFSVPVENFMSRFELHTTGPSGGTDNRGEVR
jgi:hypothetical protein